MTGMEICPNSAESQTVTASDSPCGACTDISLNLDSSLPADARTGVRLSLASQSMIRICDSSMLSIQRHGIESDFPSSQDSRPSAIRTIVLIV